MINLKIYTENITFNFYIRFAQYYHIYYHYKALYKVQYQSTGVFSYIRLITGGHLWRLPGNAWLSGHWSFVLHFPLALLPASRGGFRPEHGCR